MSVAKKPESSARHSGPSSQAPGRKCGPAKATSTAKRTAPARARKATAAKPAKPVSATAPRAGVGEVTKVPINTDVQMETAMAAQPTVEKLPVREGEDAWTEEELDEIRDELNAEVLKHQKAIEQAEAELRTMLADGSEGAGRDPADVGSANFERDQEMSLAANARTMLDQSLTALRAIENATYGRCENCGQPIGKGRLQVYPRATMCLTCKQRQERR